MFKLNLAEEATKLAGNKAQEAGHQMKKRDGMFCLCNSSVGGGIGARAICQNPLTRYSQKKCTIPVIILPSKYKIRTAKVNTAGQSIQQAVDQATEAGQKVLDDGYKSAQEAGEKAVQSVTSQVTAWGKSFGLSEENKDVST